jgi:dTDP-4-dehydrorhamnose 3,5-epimerase
MKKIRTDFSGLYIIQNEVFKDYRGMFVKTYSQTRFRDMDLDININERYFSVSEKDVIRGMHFQTPPTDHIKLVSVLQGSILDVVLDIRKGSLTYGKCFSIEIKAEEGKSIYIPKGFAHGFKALESNTIMQYNQTTEYSPSNDAGIMYNSFGFKWDVQNAILSERDLKFKSFNNFKSPF